MLKDHIDNDWRNRDPSNLRLLCRSCNRRNTSKVMSVREKNSLPSTHIDGIWSGKEGAKHEIMRSRWDKWVESLGTAFTLKESSMTDKAPSACGKIAKPFYDILGSSVTYRRYLNEDIAAGKLDRFQDAGVWWIVPIPTKPIVEIAPEEKKETATTK